MKIQIYKSKGKFRYRMIASNGKKMEANEAYERHAGLMNNIFSKWLFFNGYGRHWLKDSLLKKQIMAEWEHFKANNIEDTTKKK